MRFQLDNGEYETVATSLPYSLTLEDVKALYHLRWEIETSFQDLKYSTHWALSISTDGLALSRSRKSTQI